MKDTLIKFFIFAAGAAVGATASMKLLEAKYKQIAQEEIDSVKAAFEAMSKSNPSDVSEDDPATEKELVREQHSEYCNIVAESGYTNGEKGGSELMDDIRPHVIPPADFGEIDDYDTETLVYYDDNILVDSNGAVIEDVDSVVGEDSLTHFGEYEDDAVHVRNDMMRCDYEILRDTSDFYSPTVSCPNPEDDE